MYRNLTKVYHPDAGYENNGDGEFIKIRNHAYVTLSDPVVREMYDMRARNRLVVVVDGERRGFYGCRRWESDQSISPSNQNDKSAFQSTKMYQAQAIDC
nr:chaperone protein DnaJ 11, chloroplastic [Tanacetum cinerariifolium]